MEYIVSDIREEREPKYEFSLKDKLNLHNDLTKKFIILTISLFRSNGYRSSNDQDWLSAMAGAAKILGVESKKNYQQFCYCDINNFLKLSEKDITDDNLSNFFRYMNFNNEIDICILSPLDYIRDVTNKISQYYWKEGNHAYDDYSRESYYLKRDRYDLCLQNEADQCRLRNYYTIAGEYGNGKSEELIEYLNNVAAIFYVLRNKNYSIDKAKTISFLVALYYSNVEKFDFNGQLKKMETFFEKCFGKDLLKKLGIPNFSQLNYPAKTIRTYFPEYLNYTGSISQIVMKECLYESEKYTTRYIHNLGISYKDLDNFFFYFQISDDMEKEALKLDGTINDFLHKTTIMYLIVKEKKITKSNYEAILLAQILCSYHINNPLSHLLIDNGITLENIIGMTLEELKDVYRTKAIYNDTIVENVEEFEVYPYFIYSVFPTLETVSLDNIILSLFENKYSFIEGTSLEKIIDNKDLLREAIAKNEERRTNEETEEKSKEIIGNVDYQTYSFLLNVSNIYFCLNESTYSTTKKELVSLLLSLTTIKGTLSDYLNYLGINRESINTYFNDNLVTNINIGDYEMMYPDIIESNFLKYIKSSGGIYSFEQIIENIFDNTISGSFISQKLLDKLNIDIEDVKDIGSKANQYLDKVKLDRVGYIKSNRACYDILIDAHKTHNKLKENNNVLLISSKDDLLVASLFISVLRRDRSNLTYENEEISQFFDNLFDAYFIDLDYILNNLGITEEDILVDNEEVSDMNLYDVFKQYIDSICNNKLAIEEDKNVPYNYDLGYIVRRLFTINIGSMDKILKNSKLSNSLKNNCLYEIIETKELNITDYTNSSISNVVPYDMVCEYLRREIDRTKSSKLDVKELEVFIDNSGIRTNKYANYCIQMMKSLDTEGSFKTILIQLSDITKELSEKGLRNFKVFSKDESVLINITKLSSLTETVREQLIELSKNKHKFEKVKNLFELYIYLEKAYYDKYVEVLNSMEETNSLYSYMLDIVSMSKERITSLYPEYDSINNIMNETEGYIKTLVFMCNVVMPILVSIHTYKSDYRTIDLKNIMEKNIIKFMEAVIKKDLSLTEEELNKLINNGLPENYVLALKSGVDELFHKSEYKSLILGLNM